LIAHHLLLGDTIMLTPLLAKLRARFADAELVMALPAAYAALYGARPYGVRALGWHPRRPGASPVWHERGFDLALVPGDNRMSWLALALGSRWIVAFDGDRPASKSWAVDELRPYPSVPSAWGDIAAMLVDGPPPSPYAPEDWPAPPAAAFDKPMPGYAVLHVGASTPLKRWPSDRWRALALALRRRGLEPVWSCGLGEQAMLRDCDDASARRYPGTLDLAQMWHLLANAALLVAPDTGIAHLGRLTDTPTVALFGPGSSRISGPGEFWRTARYRAVTVDPFACRDQRVLFKRRLDWVRRCGRTPTQCPHPRCMDALDVEVVVRAIDVLGVQC
jgi:ADP-heptose:LPS heptosyltransferase